MKLSPILAQYLYTNKLLQLAGIGRFLIDSSIPIEIESTRNQKIFTPLNVKFEQDTSVKPDPALIAFISQQSGKMKSLAAADLDSHLELAIQFLNIGKPFQFEGIGTLVKKKAGNFDFIPGHLLNEKMKDSYNPQSDPTSSTEESFTQYNDMLSARKSASPSLRQLAVVLALFAGLALAIWGGYTIYKKGASIQKDTAPEQTTTANTVQQDTVTENSSNGIPGTFRFVIEKSAKIRALSRFKALKSYGADVRLETDDSLFYKLLFILPATPKDTLRIRDSLTVLYVNSRYMKGNRALVE